jgi:uncharacterized protein (DUF1501 family)
VWRERLDHPHIRQAIARRRQWNHVNVIGAGRVMLRDPLMQMTLVAPRLGLRRSLGRTYSDTTIVLFSEFGRTVRENGNGGTDHGHGNVMWVMGGGIRGGRVHGAWPGLSVENLYQGRDLAVQTDFRMVLQTVLRQQLGLDQRQMQVVLPGFGNAAILSGLVSI